MDARKDLQWRLRAEVLEPDDIILRGGPDSPAKLVAHARRANERLRYGEEIYGISVFAAVDEVGDASLDGLLSGRLGTTAWFTCHLPAYWQRAASG